MKHRRPDQTPTITGGGRNARPYVAAALICEEVIQDTNGVLTLVKIVDTFAYELVGGSAPGALPAITFHLVVSLKSGGVKGKAQVTFTWRTPTQVRNVPESYAIELNGGEHGHNLVLKLTLPMEDGLHWFDVLWNGNVLTSIPARVRRSPAVTLAPGKTN